MKPRRFREHDLHHVQTTGIVFYVFTAVTSVWQSSLGRGAVWDDSYRIQYITAGKAWWWNLRYLAIAYTCN